MLSELPGQYLSETAISLDDCFERKIVPGKFQSFQLIAEDCGCCTYVIGSDSTKEFLIVDPLMDVERFLTKGQ